MTAGHLRTLPSHPRRSFDDEERSTISCNTHVKGHYHHDEWQFARRQRRGVTFSSQMTHVIVVERIPDQCHVDVWYSRTQFMEFRMAAQHAAASLAQTAGAYGSLCDVLHRIFHAFRSSSQPPVDMHRMPFRSTNLETLGLESLAVPAIQRDIHVRRRYLLEQVHQLQQQMGHYHDDTTKSLRQASQMASHAACLYAQFLAQRSWPQEDEVIDLLS